MTARYIAAGGWLLVALLAGRFCLPLWRLVRRGSLPRLPAIMWTGQSALALAAAVALAVGGPWWITIMCGLSALTAAAGLLLAYRSRVAAVLRPPYNPPGSDPGA